MATANRVGLWLVTQSIAHAQCLVSATKSSCWKICIELCRSGNGKRCTGAGVICSRLQAYHITIVKPNLHQIAVHDRYRVSRNLSIDTDHDNLGCVLMIFAPILNGEYWICKQELGDAHPPLPTMSGSVVHKIPPLVKRVEFKEKSTTRGIRFKQSTVKAKLSPSRAPSKRSHPSLTKIESVDQGEFDEPLIQYKGKVSSTVEYGAK